MAKTKRMCRFCGYDFVLDRSFHACPGPSDHRPERWGGWDKPFAAAVVKGYNSYMLGYNLTDNPYMTMRGNARNPWRKAWSRGWLLAHLDVTGIPIEEGTDDTPRT